MYGCVCMAMYIWLCMPVYGYVFLRVYGDECMAVYVWLCMYGYVCVYVRMFVWL